MSLPTFMIVGTGKGGTSALSRAMKNHPDVFVPRAKELHFFDRHHEKGAGWYEAQFEDAPAGSVAGEATPYMYNLVAMGRLADLLPEARCIAILRNPVDRAYSHFWHNLRRGRESGTFEDAIARERSEDFDPLATPVYAYLDHGRYAIQLETIEKRHGRERMLVLENAELRHQRAQTLDRAWRFIGVDPGHGTVDEAKRPLRWHIRSKLSPGRRARNAGYPKIDPGLRAELVAEMLPDVVAVEEWWGRSLPSWRT